MDPTKIAHKLLLILNPEKAHSIGKWAMKKKLCAPGKLEITGTTLFGRKINNPLGIAAGFDKYADLHDVVKDYGFGFIESGSYTWEGGQGNIKPRKFRLKSGDLINRMGLNCIPSVEAAEILRDAKDPNSFAVNIAKTHNPNITGDAAIRDIFQSLLALKNLGLYNAINISCPNTKEGKTFEEPESLTELISAIKETKKGRPLVLKLSPNIGKNKLEKLVEISHNVIDGYEAVNTLPIDHPKYGRGGLSGPTLKKQTLNTIKFLRSLTNKTLLAVGGISTGEDIYNLQQAGANAFLSLTGFTYLHKNNPYAGPNFTHKSINEYAQLLNTQ